MKPDEVNEHNVKEAKAQLVSNLKEIVTAYRRIEETLVAVARNTGNPRAPDAANRVRTAMVDLETQIDDLLRSEDH